jgi:hypothetical protein
VRPRLFLFSLGVVGQKLAIEKLEAVTSDPSTSYQILLFAEDPQDDTYDWKREDLIQMLPVNRRRLTQPLNDLRINLPKIGSNFLYFGVALKQRPINVQTESWNSKTGLPTQSYFDAPAYITITLFYRLV